MLPTGTSPGSKPRTSVPDKLGLLSTGDTPGAAKDGGTNETSDAAAVLVTPPGGLYVTKPVAAPAGAATSPIGANVGDGGAFGSSSIPNAHSFNWARAVAAIMSPLPLICFAVVSSDTITK